MSQMYAFLKKLERLQYIEAELSHRERARRENLPPAARWAQCLLPVANRTGGASARGANPLPAQALFRATPRAGAHCFPDRPANHRLSEFPRPPRGAALASSHTGRRKLFRPCCPARTHLPDALPPRLAERITTRDGESAVIARKIIFTGNGQARA